MLGNVVAAITSLLIAARAGKPWAIVEVIRLQEAWADQPVRRFGCFQVQDQQGDDYRGDAVRERL